MKQKILSVSLERKSGGKGRPQKIYKLKMTVKEISKMLEANLTSSIERTQVKLKRLNKLVSEICT